MCTRVPAAAVSLTTHPHTSPSLTPPTRRLIHLAVAVAAYLPSLSPPTPQLIFSRQCTSAPPLLLPSQPICSRQRIAFAFRKLPPSPLPAQLIFSRRCMLSPSSPLPSQIICSRRRTHTAAAVAFTSPLSSPPTAQLIFSCQRPHIVSTVPFTCGHPRINPNAFYSHPTHSFIKNIPKKLL